MEKVNAADFAAFLTQRVRAGDGYIMGAVGQDPKKLSAWYYNQYKGSQYTKAVYWKNHAQRVWDCNGLAEGYYKDITGKDINTRARYNYSGWCGEKGKGMIPAEKRVRGAAVFFGETANAITHVAFLTRPVNENDPRGDWILTEARGVSYGVVETVLSKRKPDFWGLMDKYFDYENASSAAGLTVAGSLVNIREGPGTGYAVVAQAKAGERLTPVNADNWRPVLVNGIVRWICADYVKDGE